jgi:predicted lipoprotein with Yx(FWY)xxD motif
MPRTRARTIVSLVACLGASTALIACGSDDDTTSTEAANPATAPATSDGSGVEVDLADNAELGQILVDSDGRTLYLFEKDDEGDESYCSGECANAWPPLITKGEPQAGSGIDASKVTTFTRDDGTTQVSYADHPLYYYAGDQAPGDTTGNELDQFGAEWYALTASGDATEDSGSDSADESGADDSSASSSDEPGSGYDY